MRCNARSRQRGVLDGEAVNARRDRRRGADKLVRDAVWFDLAAPAVSDNECGQLMQDLNR